MVTVTILEWEDRASKGVGWEVYWFAGVGIPGRKVFSQYSICVNASYF